MTKAFRRLLIIACAAFGAGGSVAIAAEVSQGAFPDAGVPLVLTAHNGKLTATARLTRTVAGPDSVLQTQWQDTFLQAPRSQVGRIRITVLGREVFVPVTAVTGPYAPNRATLKADKAASCWRSKAVTATLAIAPASG